MLLTEHLPTSTSVVTYDMVTAGNALYMGDYNDGGTAPDANRYFQGGMENVAVYSNALTLGQIANHYTYGTTFAAPSNTAPSISSQPSSLTNYVGQTATFHRERNRHFTPVISMEGAVEWCLM